MVPWQGSHIISFTLYAGNWACCVENGGDHISGSDQMIPEARQLTVVLNSGGDSGNRGNTAHSRHILEVGSKWLECGGWEKGIILKTAKLLAYTTGLREWLTKMNKTVEWE